MELLNGEKRSRNRGPPPSWGRRPRDEIGGVLHFSAYLQDGEASPAAGAGPFLEIGEERALFQERNHKPSRSFSRSCSQPRSNESLQGEWCTEITSFDRSMYRKFKFCLRLHKLGAFLKCFSCSHLFVSWNSDTKV